VTPAFPKPEHRQACRHLGLSTTRAFVHAWNHGGPDIRTAIRQAVETLSDWSASEWDDAVSTGDIPKRVDQANTAFIAARYSATIEEHNWWLRRLKAPSLERGSTRRPAPATTQPRSREHRSHSRVTRAGPNDDDPSEPPAANPRHRPAWEPIEGDPTFDALVAVPTLTRLKRARHEIIEGAWMPCPERWRLIEAALWPLAQPPLTAYNGNAAGEVTTGHKIEPRAVA
jgi:hypothetical protein